MKKNKVTPAIFGVGIDLVEMCRIEHSLKQLGARFVNRIAHPQEIKAAPRALQTQYWASRFAAKEAFSKALGTGIGSTVRFKDVGVSKKKSGQPQLVFSSRLKSVLKKHKITRSHLSLTHTDSFAAAIVILER